MRICSPTYWDFRYLSLVQFMIYEGWPAHATLLSAISVSHLYADSLYA
ncbi:unnamed protein product [marine sediment metagenome]|uniref:Uncharacterized protein n=1 Tax=marine sediment metagenome TaxID=412755 RepID=X1LM97_9ZZZZ